MPEQHRRQRPTAQQPDQPAAPNRAAAPDQERPQPAQTSPRDTVDPLSNPESMYMPRGPCTDNRSVSAENIRPNQRIEFPRIPTHHDGEPRSHRGSSSCAGPFPVDRAASSTERTPRILWQPIHRVCTD